MREWLAVNKDLVRDSKIALAVFFAQGTDIDDGGGLVAWGRMETARTARTARMDCNVGGVGCVLKVKCNVCVIDRSRVDASVCAVEELVRWMTDPKF